MIVVVVVTMSHSNSDSGPCDYSTSDRSLLTLPNLISLTLSSLFYCHCPLYFIAMALSLSSRPGCDGAVGISQIRAVSVPASLNGNPDPVDVARLGGRGRDT